MSAQPPLAATKIKAYRLSGMTDSELAENSVVESCWEPSTEEEIFRARKRIMESFSVGDPRADEIMEVLGLCVYTHTHRLIICTGQFWIQEKLL